MTRWIAVQGKALEANTTREFGQRAANSVRYSCARARDGLLVNDQRRRTELIGEIVDPAAADHQRVVVGDRTA